MPSPNTHFVVTTLNLFNYLAPPNAYYQLDNIYTREEWQKKQHWLNQHIIKLNSDIVGFQEVFSHHELKDQTFALGYPYFACLATPKIESDYIYSQPPVALASRFPITQLSLVSTSELEHVPTGFDFSRAPLHVTLDTPTLGLCDVYVVHLKSQRSSIERQEGQPVQQQWHNEIMGQWQSSIQRGTEARLLHQFVTKVKTETGRPCLILGDFNQDIRQPELSSLLSRGLFRQANSADALAAYHLFDSYELAQSVTTPRPSTHYLAEKGSILDYILASGEFHPQSATRRATILRHHVADQHLIRPSFEQDQFSSDHASVSITIRCD